MRNALDGPLSVSEQKAALRAKIARMEQEMTREECAGSDALLTSALMKLPEYEPHFLLTVDRVNNTDTSELKVEVKDEYFTDDMATMVGLQKKLESELRSVIGLGFKVKLVEPKGIERSEGKAKRVIDKRKFEK